MVIHVPLRLLACIRRELLWCRRILSNPSSTDSQREIARRVLAQHEN